MAASARHSGAREGEEDSDASTESLAPVSPLLLGLSAEFSLPDLSAQPNTSQNPGVWSAEGQGTSTHSFKDNVSGRKRQIGGCFGRRWCTRKEQGCSRTGYRRRCSRA